MRGNAFVGAGGWSIAVCKLLILCVFLKDFKKNRKNAKTCLTGSHPLRINPSRSADKRCLKTELLALKSIIK